MRGYRLILFMLALLVSVGMKGQYDPTSPPEPGVYHTLRLEAMPTDGGRFNIGSTQAYSAGSRVSLRAYANSSFRFVAWEENGYVVSTSSSFTYTMPSADVTLTARFVYDPSSPAEPPMPDLPVYSTITLSASPTDGGRFNIGSSARYEVGSRVLLSAYAASNFAFTCWTEGADTVSTSSSFYYTVGETDTHLVANFAYTPGNPDEPSAPVVAHKLFIESSPAGGGTFNIGSGSSFIEGDMVPLYAHKNQWYTFTAWTIDGDTVSTDELLTFTMPDHDVTITANFTYDYNPSNPGEPSQGAGGVNIYGMTESGMRGQTVAYPVYLENSTPVSGMAVDMKFPQGFSVDASAVTLAGRAAGHSLAVTALEDNTYRFEITGEADFSGTNGKLFDVEVGIPDTATMNRNYTVELSHGVAHTTAGTHEAVPVRSGCIYVERLTEDGLYARFSFDKLLNRVQFSNQSSAKATTFHWNFGDGTESTEANPLHTYAAPGYYDVTLTAYGEHGEDVAQATILVNDSAHWTLDGTFLLTDKATGVRHFTSPDELLAFVSCASVTGNISLQVATDSTFTLSLTPENTTRLDALADRLASQSLSLRITGGSQASTPRLGIGSEGDAPTAELVALYNALAEVSTCDGVDMSLCGVGYNPSRIEDIADQTVKSGAATVEMDFTRISQELTFAWELTEKPDSADVAGYETAGEGNIPAMFIDNIGDTAAVLTYSVTGSYGGLQFCRFTKTITVTPGTATLDEAEWQLLVELRETLAAGGWPTPWDMSCGAEGAATLDGVTLSRGHVVGIDLSGQSLGGGFPTAALRLPRLERLSLADNRLVGDAARAILQDITIYAAQRPGFVSPLRSLDISGNGFTGNVGLLAALAATFPSLAELDAAGNGFGDVAPALPATLSRLDLTRQNTARMLNVDMANPDLGEVVAQVPTLMVYDHGAQAYRNTPRVRVSDTNPATAKVGAGAGWAVDIDLATGQPSLTQASGGAYRGLSGDTLFVSYPPAAPEVAGSSCLATFTFEKGDADFVGGVAATDLQATILYIFGEYAGRPFNFTAADTYPDDVVNVQDVVATVGLLLRAGPAAGAAHSPARGGGAGAPGSATARIYASGGVVYLQSEVPVAALHIASSGDIEWHLARYGMEQAAAKGGVVGYSLSGLALPAGLTAIGTCEGPVAISAASLSDAEARPVDVSPFNPAPTGIGGVAAGGGEPAVYDARGVRRTSPGKGLNIIKAGKKAAKVINK